jgi:hypothetical protein
MALVQDHFEATVTLTDKGGNDTTRTYQFIDNPTDGNISGLITQLNGLLVFLQAVTKLVIKKYTISRVGINDAFALPTDAGAEAEAHAIVTAPIHGKPLKSATVDIPAPEDAVMVGTSGAAYNQVDPASSVLVAYLDSWTDGNAVNFFTLSDGETIDQVNVRGKRTHSRSTKG